MRLGAIPDRPLRIVYFDHVKIEDYVVDERTGETGYPWLTLAIDANTRMVAGFHLSLAPPSRVSLSLCLLHAVCDKARWMNERGICGDWPAAGLPEIIAIDPQSIFGFRQLARAWRDQGIATASESINSAVFGTRATHMFGGRFGKVAIAKANGVSWTPRAPRHVRRALARDIRELEFAVADGLVNDYHHRPHKDTRRTPLDGWREAEAAAPLRAPQDCMGFRLSLLPEALCALGSSGVSVLGETFWSPGLAQLHREGRERVAVKFDPRDLSRIFVQETGKPSMEATNIAATSGGASDEACRRNCKLLVSSLPRHDAARGGAENPAEAGRGHASPEGFGRLPARYAARNGGDEGLPQIDQRKAFRYARTPPSSAGALKNGNADS